MCPKNITNILRMELFMMDIRKQSSSKTSQHTKLRTYQEVIAYLDAHWSIKKPAKALERIKQLDVAFDTPSKKVSALMVGGTNGKSLTVHLATKLLQTEGLKVGGFMSPHILTYNERITLNLESVPNKNFTEIGNDVINMAESLNIEAHSDELLTMMALLFFVEQKVDVAIMEISSGGIDHPVNICNALVATLTRITPRDVHTTEDMLAPAVKEAMGIVKKGTWFVSGDQCKANLELMHEATTAQGGNWAMPIRKLAPLAYPFEQLHGRCAALAERIAIMFMERYHNKHVTITTDTLLSKKEGKRGRPTLIEKRKAEQQPKTTLDQFWHEALSELPGKFQILEKERPPVLLDTASNIDAFTNILLGIRLTHYERSLKGLVIIMAAAKDTLHSEEFLKVVRYFFKKTSGHLFICPIENPLPGLNEEESWDVEKVTNDIKSMKIKARACKDFNEAFDAAKKLVDEKQGLIAITGSHSIINTYWHHKGIKKL